MAEILTDREILSIIEKYLGVMESAIKANIINRGRQASGDTGRSLHVEMSEIGGALVGRPYFQSLEEGRPAGKVPYQFHKRIYQWMIYKNIIDQFDKPKSAAWLIARHIESHGTQLHKHPERDIYTPILDIYGGELESKVVGVVNQKLSERIKKAFENG